MLFEILTGSISAIAGVTTILRNLEAQSQQETARNILYSINEMKNRVNNLIRIQYNGIHHILCNLVSMNI